MSILKKSIASLAAAMTMAGGLTAFASSPVDETYTTLPLKQTKAEGTLIFLTARSMQTRQAFCMKAPPLPERDGSIITM